MGNRPVYARSLVQLLSSFIASLLQLAILSLKLKLMELQLVDETLNIGSLRRRRQGRCDGNAIFGSRSKRCHSLPPMSNVAPR